MDFGWAPESPVELIGNVAFTLFLQERCCLVDAHLSLVRKRGQDVERVFHKSICAPVSSPIPA